MTHKPSLKLFVSSNLKNPDIGSLCQALYTDHVLKITRLHPSHDAILTRARELGLKDRYRSVLPVFLRMYDNQK